MVAEPNEGGRRLFSRIFPSKKEMYGSQYRRYSSHRCRTPPWPCRPVDRVMLPRSPGRPFTSFPITVTRLMQTVMVCHQRIRDLRNLRPNKRLGGPMVVEPPLFRLDRGLVVRNWDIRTFATCESKV